MAMIAGVVGATGLVGKATVAQLCNDASIDAVHVFVRHPLTDATITVHPKLHQHVIDFDRLAESEWPYCDMLFCCLGTTIKTAGSKPAFRTVDVDYVIESARRARQAGASRLLVVSAMGANPRSKTFYNAVKGEMEEAVVMLGYDAIALFRPSLLDGKRTENRPAERFALIAMKLGNLFLPKKYRSISSVAVARAMIATAKTHRSGVVVIESDQMQRFA